MSRTRRFSNIFRRQSSKERLSNEANRLQGLTDLLKASLIEPKHRSTVFEALIEQLKDQKLMDYLKTHQKEQEPFNQMLFNNLVKVLNEASINSPNREAFDQGVEQIKGFKNVFFLPNTQFAAHLNIKIEEAEKSYQQMQDALKKTEPEQPKPQQVEEALKAESKEAKPTNPLSAWLTKESKQELEELTNQLRSKPEMPANPLEHLENAHAQVKGYASQFDKIGVMQGEIEDRQHKLQHDIKQYMKKLDSLSFSDPSNKKSLESDFASIKTQFAQIQTMMEAVDHQRQKLPLLNISQARSQLNQAISHVKTAAQSLMTTIGANRNKPGYQPANSEQNVLNKQLGSINRAVLRATELNKYLTNRFEQIHHAGINQKDRQFDLVGQLETLRREYGQNALPTEQKITHTSATPQPVAHSIQVTNVAHASNQAKRSNVAERIMPEPNIRPIESQILTEPKHHFIQEEMPRPKQGAHFVPANQSMTNIAKTLAQNGNQSTEKILKSERPEPKPSEPQKPINRELETVANARRVQDNPFKKADQENKEPNIPTPRMGR